MSIALALTLSCQADGNNGTRADDPAIAPPDFGTLNPTAPPETRHWGQLAGVWGCVVSTPADGGPVTESTATWTWRYILDGHAVQDVYASGTSSFRGTGTRIYHSSTASWEISWTANSPPAAGVPRITRFTATSTDNEVVMRRGNGDPNWRTVFYDIGPERFAWLSEPSGQTMVCERSSG